MMNAEEKYREAILLYEQTDLSLTEIATRCNVSRKSLSAYIYRARRDLLMKRNGKSHDHDTKLRSNKGQRNETTVKYRDALVVMTSMKHLELNISEVARMFDHNPSAFANHLRNHHSGLLENREELRRERGMADNKQRGARHSSTKAYAAAVEALRQSESLSIRQAAADFDVSYSGLHQHLLHYHKELLERRERLKTR